MKHSLRLITIILVLIPFGAGGQWAWTDQNGRKVFSDRPPSSDVADKDISKRPGGVAAPSPKTTDTNQAATDPATKSPIPSNRDAARSQPGDKELTERKKKADQAQAAQRQAEQERNNKVRTENCARATQAQQGLNSGVRIGVVNSKGEREVMDEAARTTEAKRLQSIIDSDCK